jgi:hypothetical protein
MSKAFSHENIELKQQLLQLARDSYAKTDSVENELAAALLYMNLADYLAEYLVFSLQELAKEAMSKYYLGIVTMKPAKIDAGFNIRHSLKQIKLFSFPQREEILFELSEINKARNKIAHEMFKVEGERVAEIDEAVKTLVLHTEELVNIVDEISVGLPPANLQDKMLGSKTGDQNSIKSKSPNKKRGSKSK